MMVLWLSRCYDKSELFNTYFSTVFTKDNGIIPPIQRVVESNVNLSFIEFSYSKVLSALKGLPSKTSRSPDGYPSLFLKSIADIIAAPFVLLFDLSMRTGAIPVIWKLGYVIPAYKRGNASSKQNYRPISLTCIACKVMETIVHKDIITYLKKYDLITAHQFGFLIKRSTCTQLLTVLHDWCDAINQRLAIDVIYIDFSKAFDTVSHEKLLAKLKSYGIAYELLSWLSSFLIGRLQQLSVGTEFSELLTVESGIPQGSVLDP